MWAHTRRDVIYTKEGKGYRSGRRRRRGEEGVGHILGASLQQHKSNTITFDEGEPIVADNRKCGGRMQGFKAETDIRRHQSHYLHKPALFTIEASNKVALLLYLHPSFRSYSKFLHQQMEFSH
jgi:hypothetical protein